MKATTKMQKFIAYGRAWDSKLNDWRPLKVIFMAKDRASANAKLRQVISIEAELLELERPYAHLVLPFPHMGYA